MKLKILTIALLSLLATRGFAQGIEFVHLSYEQALAKAKAEKKAIFIDTYTTWCGPCRVMSQTIFPQKDVGDFYNANFVNLKLDAENESTHGFFKKYKPSAFPTYYWINEEGELLNTETGSTSAQNFIAHGKKAKTSTLNVQERAYAERWKKGERSYELVTKYIYGILSKTKPAEVHSSMESYFSSISEKELQEPKNSALLLSYMRSPKKGVILDAILKYSGAHEKNIGYLAFNQSMYRMVVRNGNAYLAQKKDTAYREHVALMKASPIPNKDMYIQLLKADSLMYTKNYSKSLATVATIAQTYGKDNPYIYREICYTLTVSKFIIEAKLNSSELTTLIDLNTKAFELQPTQETIGFLAAAYAKANDYKKAYEIASTGTFYSTPQLPAGIYRNFLQINPKIITDWGKTAEAKAWKESLAEKEKENGKKPSNKTI
ncbi:thioredoxin family protein [Pedobacter sp. MW01-1-1]|uniref:thioredoxin family protein n=1 Tax=Pedobacter sp. MW01-1-1 TaxID=3383027 RepID=UPI003FF0C5AF